MGANTFVHVLFKGELDGPVRKDRKHEASFKNKLDPTLSVRLHLSRVRSPSSVFRVHHPASGISAPPEDGVSGSFRIKRDSLGLLHIPNGETMLAQSPGSFHNKHERSYKGGARFLGDSAARGDGSVVEPPEASGNSAKLVAVHPQALDIGVGAPQIAREPAQGATLAVVLFDYEATSDHMAAHEEVQEEEVAHLQLRSNDIVTVVRKEKGWWLGEYDGKMGWFPSRYCVELS